MFDSRRRRSHALVLMTVAFALTPAIGRWSTATLGFQAVATQKPSAGRITVAANVTLRALPSTTAATVAQLPLGTELTDAGVSDLDRTWVRVKLADGREGWLRVNLTKPIDPAWRWPTFDRIIAERLGRRGDGFTAQAELVAFIERVAPEYTDPEGRARIDLARLRAIQMALGAMPFDAGRKEPYAAWIAAKKADVTYFEQAGRWIITSTTIWDLQTKHNSTTSADDLAWFAVTNGLPGECEGYLPCYLRWRNRLQGEYLRRLPNGRHVDEVVALVKETADSLTSTRYEFERARDCGELTASVDGLIGAIKATRSPAKDAAIGSLTTIRKLCGTQ